MLKEMLQYSAPLIFAALAVQLWAFLDRHFILNRFGETALGVYALSIKFASPLVLGFTIIESIIGPMVLKHAEEQGTKSMLRRLFILHIILLLCI